MMYDKGGIIVDLFNIICGGCSIAGLLVSVFTASKVIKISQSINCRNQDDHLRVINKGSRNTYNGDYVGRDSINAVGSGEQK